MSFSFAVDSGTCPAAVRLAFRETESPTLRPEAVRATRRTGAGSGMPASRRSRAALAFSSSAVTGRPLISIWPRSFTMTKPRLRRNSTSASSGP